MALGLNLRFPNTSVGYSRTQTGMRTSPVVVGRPGFQDLPNVRFIEGNHEVQTLSAYAADQTFTESLGLWRSIRRL